MSEQSDHVREAIANADAQLNNIAFPNYSAVIDALRSLAAESVLNARPEDDVYVAMAKAKARALMGMEK